MHPHQLKTIGLTFLLINTLFAPPSVRADGWTTFFPDGLIDDAGEPLDPTMLNGKLVGLFFSAEWCGPCRAFSPYLNAFRETYRDQFEVVFISHDRGDEEQLHYMSRYEMPWPGLRHSDARTQELKTEFGVGGIPTLIVLSQQGDFLDADARTWIQFPATIARRQASGNIVWESMIESHFSEWVENYAARVVYPEEWRGDAPLVIRYEPRQANLSGANVVHLHYGFDGWSGEVLNQAMTQVEEGVWEFEVVPRPGAQELNFCFANGPLGEEETRWDNNGGTDWRVSIAQ